MKYAAFGVMLLAGVPLMAFGAMSMRRVRDWLFSALFAAACFGKMTSINFVSMETYRGPDRGFEVTLADLICWALIAALVAKHRRNIRWIPYNTWVLAAFFAVGVVATALSPEPVYGAFTLFKLLRLYLIYWCVTNLIIVGMPLDHVWYGMMGTATIMTILAFKQKYLDGYYRIPGPFDHSNTIPLFVNLIAPALLVWGLADRRLTPGRVVASLAGVSGLAFSVVATFSRAGIALMAASLVLALIAANTRGRSLRAQLASVMVLIVFLGGAAKASSSMMARIELAPKASEEARDEFNTAAALMLSDHFFGVGLNNFSLVLSTTPKYNAVIKVMKDEAQAGVCHHIYRLTAAEMGYPGVALFLLVLLRFTWRSFRYAFRAARLDGLLMIAFGLGFTATNLGGLLEWAFRVTPVMQTFAVAAAISCGLAELARKGAASPRLA